MGHKGWKKAVVILAGMSVMAGSAAQAESPEDFWAYTQAVDEDGNLVYEFDEIEVTLPADWEGKYGIETGVMESGELYIEFYHEAVREAYEIPEETDAVGVLLSINYSQNYDFQNWMNATSIVGSGAAGVYFISYMQDDQALWMENDAAEEWFELCKECEWIEEHIKVTNPGEGIADPDNVKSGVGSEDGEYIVADSSKRYLEVSDLAGMNADELQMAINEIYARHHRKFVTRSIQEYFDSKSWYSGTVEAAKFDETSLNQYEGKNIALMIQCMNNSSTSNTSAAGAGTVTSGTAMYATTTVNIRSKASTAGAIMGVVPQGYSVTATGSAVNGWIPVNYNGIKGYISQEYLKAGKGTDTASTSEKQNTNGVGSSENGSNSGAVTEDSITGTILSKDSQGVEIQDDAGNSYYFSVGEWTTYTFGEVGDYVEISYWGKLSDAPQIQSMVKKSSAEELESGTHTMEGTIVFEGNDIVNVQTADGNTYQFLLSIDASKPENYEVGDYVSIEYKGSLDAPETIRMTKY